MGTRLPHFMRPTDRPPEKPPWSPAQDSGEAEDASAPNATHPKATIRVAIIDDHAMLNDSLRLFFQIIDGMSFAWSALTAAESLDRLREDTPDLLLVDITLPDRSGIEVIKDIRHLRPKLPMIALTMHEEGLYGQRAIKAGARGYLMKGVSHEELIGAVRKVAAGGFYVSETTSSSILHSYSETADQQVPQERLTLLTEKEQQVFQMIGSGHTPTQIAQRLGIRHRTLTQHILSIRRKLHLPNRNALLKRALQSHFQPSSEHGTIQNSQSTAHASFSHLLD